MQIIRKTLERMTIESFADQHGLKMLVREAACGPRVVVVAHFDGEVELYPGPTNEAGEGETEEEAIQDYAERISGKVLVIDPKGGVARKQIKIPLLHYGAAGIAKIKSGLDRLRDPHKPMLNA